MVQFIEIQKAGKIVGEANTVQYIIYTSIITILIWQIDRFVRWTNDDTETPQSCWNWLKYCKFYGFGSQHHTMFQICKRVTLEMPCCQFHFHGCCKFIMLQWDDTQRTCCNTRRDDTMGWTWQEFMRQGQLRDCIAKGIAASGANFMINYVLVIQLCQICFHRNGYVLLYNPTPTSIALWSWLGLDYHWHFW